MANWRPSTRTLCWAAPRPRQGRPALAPGCGTTRFPAGANRRAAWEDVYSDGWAGESCEDSDRPLYPAGGIERAKTRAFYQFERIERGQSRAGRAFIIVTSSVSSAASARVSKSTRSCRAQASPRRLSEGRRTPCRVASASLGALLSPLFLCLFPPSLPLPRTHAPLPLHSSLAFTLPSLQLPPSHPRSPPSPFLPRFHASRPPSSSSLSRLFASFFVPRSPSPSPTRSHAP